ncbi:hypothetical protein Tco_0664885 [Tanacetum coccineum]
MAEKCLLEAKIDKKELLKKQWGALESLLEDTVDHIETENAQDEGRTRDIVDEDKEIEENVLSTEDVLSTDKDKLVLSRRNSTEEHIEGIEVQIESTDGQRKGNEVHTEEGCDTSSFSNTSTSTFLDDDENT